MANGIGFCLSSLKVGGLKNVRCNSQELPAYFSAEFESLVWGQAGTEPGEGGQSPPFNLQVKISILIHTKQHFGSFFNNATKKARDTSALISPNYQCQWYVRYNAYKLFSVKVSEHKHCHTISPNWLGPPITRVEL